MCHYLRSAGKLASNFINREQSMPFVAANTPVIVGASQFTERINDPDYAMLSPVAITARAAELALADAGMADCRAHIDTLMTTRIFEDSAPHLEGPFGRSNNFPRSVCQRLGMTPETAYLGNQWW
jgi:acetyl-CoA C-acetyltransferase